MKKLSLSALLAAGVLAGGMSTANAADLGVGGNCCADLEERIAELEATTARKGNRKVSLTISGWVSQQISVWDDGVEKNAYVSDLGSTLNSNFKLSGSAQIASGLSAGYLMQVEVVGNENLLLNADISAAGKGLAVIQSFWFVKSDTLGKLSVGTQSSAADNAALLPDGSGSLVFANYIMYDINNFSTRFAGAKTGVNWGSFATCQAFYGSDSKLGLGMDCDGVPNNNVRYDTPTFGGFSASASIGEDKIGALSARYAGEFNGVKVSAAIGYAHNDQIVIGKDRLGTGNKDADALQIGAYVQHVPTGLFVYGADGHDYNNHTGFLGGSGLVQQQKDADNYYIKAGFRQRWNSLGHSVVYGEYGNNEDKLSNSLWQQGYTGSNLEQWGVGFVQEIDAAAMALFMNYRHYQADLTCGNASCGGGTNSGFTGTSPVTGFTRGAGKTSFDDAQLFKLGALINF